MIRLEEGKFYLNRSGDVIGPIVRNSDPVYVWRVITNNGYHSFTAEGLYIDKDTSGLDLMELHIPCEECKPALCIEEGKFYLNKSGTVVGPIVRNNDPVYVWRVIQNNGHYTFSVDGLFAAHGDSNLDLVKEYVPVVEACEEVKPDLCIEEGKYYLTKSGDTVGPMMFNNHPQFPWQARCSDGNTHTFMTDGSYFVGGASKYDLVEEVKPDLCIEEGKFYIDRSGTVVGPIVRNNDPVYVWKVKRHCGYHSFTANGLYINDDTSGLDLIGLYIPCEEGKPALCIEEGKFYLNKAGDMIGPMMRNYDPMYKWKCIKDTVEYTFKADGSYFSSTLSSLDLVEECIPCIEAGKMYQLRNGRIIGPMIYNHNNARYPFRYFERDENNNVHVVSYTSQGMYTFDGEHDFDIVCEVRIQSVAPLAKPELRSCWAVTNAARSGYDASVIITEPMTLTEVSQKYCTVLGIVEGGYEK